MVVLEAHQPADQQQATLKKKTGRKILEELCHHVYARNSRRLFAQLTTKRLLVMWCQRREISPQAHFTISWLPVLTTCLMVSSHKPRQNRNKKVSSPPAGVRDHQTETTFFEQCRLWGKGGYVLEPPRMYQKKIR